MSFFDRLRAGNANEKFGWFVSALLGGAWTVVTFFVVPVLVVERVGPLKAIQRSWQVMRKTWGESIAGHIGVGWALLPFWLIGFGAIFLGVFVASKVMAVGVAILALTVVYFLILSLVEATLNGILLSALYLYSINGEVPDEFDRDSFEQAFTHKKSA